MTLKGVAQVDDRAAPAGTRVIALRAQDGLTVDTFTAPGGRYALRLLPGDYHVRIADEEGLLTPSRVIDGTSDAVVDLVAGHRQSPPPEARSWAERTELRIRTSDPSSGIEDLRGLSSLVGSARVVGLGEATHGTREFFQLKHRLIEALVTEQQFDVVAIEAPYARTLVANDYVTTGFGNLRGAVWSLSATLLDTEEVRDLVAWLRSWNATHTRR